MIARAYICEWCEKSYDAMKSNALEPIRFCSLTCELYAADAERKKEESR